MSEQFAKIELKPLQNWNDEDPNARNDSGVLIEKNCLGRNFHLGTIYDCLKDQIIPGATLWDLDKLSSDSVLQISYHRSYVEVLCENTFDEKSIRLTIDGDLRLSLLGGMIDGLKGHAKFLYNSKKSEHIARGAMYISLTTFYEELTMSQLAKNKLQHLDVIEHQLGTHVVVAVESGIDAFLVFEEKHVSEESAKQAEGGLISKLNKIKALIEVGGGASAASDVNKIFHSESFHCIVLCDLALEKAPVSVEDVIQLYKQIPQLVLQKAYRVPKRVWLYPLCKFDPHAVQFKNQIQAKLVASVQEIFENLNEAERKISDLLDCPEIVNFNGYIGSLEKFKQLLMQYKLCLQQALAALLPAIRSKQQSEQSLITLMERIHKSAFAPCMISAWLETKKGEEKILAKYVANLKDIPFQNAMEFDQLLANCDEYGHVVCLQFSLPDINDNFLDAMQSQLLNHPQFDHIVNIESKPTVWTADKAIIIKNRLQINAFRAFVNENVENSGLKFIWIGHKRCMETSDSIGAQVHHYDLDGMDSETIFNPPIAPKEPIIIEKTHNSVYLKWEPPADGADAVTRYIVRYSSGATSYIHEQWQLDGYL